MVHLTIAVPPLCQGQSVYHLPPAMVSSVSARWRVVQLRNSTSPLSIYAKKTKTLSWKGVCTPMFIAALFTVANIWKQHK